MIFTKTRVGFLNVASGEARICISHSDFSTPGVEDDVVLESSRIC